MKLYELLTPLENVAWTLLPINMFIFLSLNNPKLSLWLLQCIFSKTMTPFLFNSVWLLLLFLLTPPLKLYSFRSWGTTLFSLLDIPLPSAEVYYYSQAVFWPLFSFCLWPFLVELSFVRFSHLFQHRWLQICVFACEHFHLNILPPHQIWHIPNRIHWFSARTALFIGIISCFLLMIQSLDFLEEREDQYLFYHLVHTKHCVFQLL